MKINRSSWHYRLIKMGDSWEIPTDLCSYVRLLIWNILVVLFTVALCTILIGAGIWSPIQLVLYGVPDQHSMMYGFSVIGSLVDVVVLVVTIMHFLERTREYN